MALPKVISQNTYDEVVLENITDFENSLQDAIKETIAEFEAQGVHLGNIITEVQLNSTGEKIVHPVLECLESIAEASKLDKLDTEAGRTLLPELNIFTAECKLTLAHRVMASKHEAYSHILRLIGLVKTNSDVLSAALQAMVAVSNGNPDILERVGANTMTELMSTYGEDMSSDVMEHLALWCRASNFRHENNRKMLFDCLVPGLLTRSLPPLAAAHPGRVVATLQALRTFTLDDDIRQEFGGAHENARHLVEAENLLARCFVVVREGAAARCPAVTAEALATLTSVTVRAEHCRAALAAGALEILRQVLEQFPAASALCKQCLAYLTAITGDDKAKRLFVEAGLHHLIPVVMDTHQMQPGVCMAACGCVSSVALRQPANATALLQSGCGDSVLQAMKQHPAELQLQKLGCLALRNLCSRSPENAAALRTLEAEGVVCTALQTHGANIRDMAKSALRDLGVEVELVEQWLGRGHEIQQ